MTRFYAPRPPKKGQRRRHYFYMFKTKDYEGVTFGHTSDPVWRFMNYEFAHGYELIGVWRFKNADDAVVHEEKVKELLTMGLLHGVVIPEPGRWTESMSESSANLLMRTMDRDARLIRISWPNEGPFHGVNAETFEAYMGKPWQRHENG